MPSTQTRLTHDWQALLQRHPAELRQRVAALASAQRADLAEYFYLQMGADPHAHPFLAHQKVKERLEPSMQRWISSLLAVQDDEELPAQVALQKQVGEIHARIDIPVSLVLRGARCLKERLAQHFAGHFDAHDLLAAVGFASQSIDIAMELMSHAYTQAHDRNSRAEEAYRLFSVSQNIGTERERQRAALLDWENQLMFEIAAGGSASQLPRVQKSEFGLWFRHKAPDSFQGAPEMQQIDEHLARIDELHLPGFQCGGNALEQLREIRETAKSVHYLLDQLFERASDIENGRDTLTQMLNRRFLPVVLGKQVATARRSGSSFALLMVDVDHFKQVNDQYGHEAGDLVLQQVAGILANSLRAGDYAFRYGGEEFLLLLVDSNAANAQTLAERIRQRVAEERLLLPAGVSLQVSVSIGLTLHDGHPDYQRSLRAADSALYQAKHGGRNRCVFVTA